jgi:ComF family protein
MGWYQGSLRDLIRLLKFSDRPDLAAPLGLRAVSYLRRQGALDGLDLIVPVPLSPFRRFRRGYNQAAELCLCLARLSGLQARCGALRRRLGSRPQAGLPANRRRANVRGQFLARRAGGLRGHSILLVDDVWTTGATLRECARVLRRAGAGRVISFSLARTPGRF